MSRKHRLSGYYLKSLAVMHRVWLHGHGKTRLARGSFEFVVLGREGPGLSQGPVPVPVLGGVEVDLTLALLVAQVRRLSLDPVEVVAEVRSRLETRESH